MIILGSTEFTLSATETLCESWYITLSICCAFLGFEKSLTLRQTVESIHLSLEEALLELVCITLGIDSSESVIFSPEIYPWFNVFTMSNVQLSSCSSNYMVKINPVLLV